MPSNRLVSHAAKNASCSSRYGVQRRRFRARRGEGRVPGSSASSVFRAALIPGSVFAAGRESSGRPGAAPFNPMFEVCTEYGSGASARPDSSSDSESVRPGVWPETQGGRTRCPAELSMHCPGRSPSPLQHVTSALGLALGKARHAQFPQAFENGIIPFSTPLLRRWPLGNPVVPDGAYCSKRPTRDARHHYSAIR